MKRGRTQLLAQGGGQEPQDGLFPQLQVLVVGLWHGQGARATRVAYPPVLELQGQWLPAGVLPLVPVKQTQGREMRREPVVLFPILSQAIAQLLCQSPQDLPRVLVGAAHLEAGLHRNALLGTLVPHCGLSVPQRQILQHVTGALADAVPQERAAVQALQVWKGRTEKE